MPSSITRYQMPVMVSREDRQAIAHLQKHHELPTGIAAVRYALKRQSVDSRMAQMSWGVVEKAGSEFTRGVASEVELTSYMVWLSEQEEEWATFIQEKYDLSSLSEAIRVAVRLEDRRVR